MLLDSLNEEWMEPSNFEGADHALLMTCNKKIRQFQEYYNTMDMVFDAMDARPYVFDFDQNGGLSSCVWSDLYRKKLGFENEEDFPNELDSWLNRIPEPHRDTVRKQLFATVNDYSGKTKFDVIYPALLKDGTERYFRSVGKVNRRDNGTPIVFVGLSYDVTDEQKRILELEEQYEIVEALSRDYLNIFMVDIPTQTVQILKLDGYVTDGFGDISSPSYPYGPFAAKYINDRVYPEDAPMLTQAMDINQVREELKDKDEYIYSYRAVDRGEVHFYQFTYLRLLSKTGKEKVIAGFKNIDQTVASAKEREELERLSRIDSMTGILNRGEGERVASEKISSGDPGVLYILDLDHFKNINDNYGHFAGDKVILAVVDALKKVFGEDDTIFRLGGDEFSVLSMGRDNQKSATGQIFELFDLLDHIDIPELGAVKPKVSVGAVMFDHAGDNSFEELYKNADSCVYKSKEKVGNSFTLFS